MAIRSTSPIYCNTCRHFDLEAAALGDGSLYCPYREVRAAWDHRACVLYGPVSDSVRGLRRVIVEQLHHKQKEKSK